MCIVKSCIMLNFTENVMKIIHITQQHNDGRFGLPQPDVLDSTLRSQIQVGLAIKRNPGCPVLAESLYEDGLDASSLHDQKTAKLVFKNGFPTSINGLNLPQKCYLYKYGAAKILFYLGEIPALYKSIHREIAEAIIEKAKAEPSGYLSRSLNAPREIEAMECAKEAALAHYESLDDATVIIVFGLLHDFKPYCDKEGYEHEVVDTVPVLKGGRFFYSDPVSSKLKDALENGGVAEYITKKHTSMQQLIEIEQETPWLITAMRYLNIKQGVYNGHVKVDQLRQLTEEQVSSILVRYEDEALGLKVQEYLASNATQKSNP